MFAANYHSMTIISVFIGCFSFRLISLFKSIFNEKRLIKSGAVEHGKTNSAVLTIVHILFYVACISESVLLEKTINEITYQGLMIYATSMFFLWWVIIALNPVWTVKLYIAKDHVLNTNWLFKLVKHPNYFLNVIPEIIGIAIICQSYYTLMIGFPIYMIPLVIRIRQENKIMAESFSDY
tara:strand:- start:1228 stop:1767 length:540 start_codon:yes stop_codon:yes gene_type:complete